MWVFIGPRSSLVLCLETVLTVEPFWFASVPDRKSSGCGVLCVITTFSTSDLIFLPVRPHSGLSAWQLSASGAPALLRGRFCLPECLWKHCLAHLCSIQQGNQRLWEKKIPAAIWHHTFQSHITQQLRIVFNI